MGSGGSNSHGGRSGPCSISYCSGSGSYNSSAPVDALEHQHGARDLDLRDEIEQLDYGGVARGGRAQPKVRVNRSRARALGLMLRSGWRGEAAPSLRLGVGLAR